MEKDFAWVELCCIGHFLITGKGALTPEWVEKKDDPANKGFVALYENSPQFPFEYETTNTPSFLLQVGLWAKGNTRSLSQLDSLT